MRKAEKRARGEAKAKQEAADRLASGLAAQKADRDRRKKQSEALQKGAQSVNQQRRVSLLDKGIDPSTGFLFTDEQMAEMEKKANTPERRHRFERIKAGRAGTLNEQPPVGGIDDYLDPMDRLTGMTVGEFRDNMDTMLAAVFPSLVTRRPELAPQFLTAEEAKKEKKADTRFPARFMETQAALKAFTRMDDAPQEPLEDPDTFEGVPSSDPIPSTRFFN